MSKEILTYDDLLQIVELIKSAEAFSEFHLKVGDIELNLSKSRDGAAPSTMGAPVVAKAAAAAAPVAAAQPQAPAAAVPVTAPRKVDVPAGAVVIAAPMVGTFYRSPEPGARPFVEVGDRVEPDTTVCIIEVMKLMNSIAAGRRGRVTQVLVADAEAVQMGQQLIIIDSTV